MTITVMESCETCGRTGPIGFTCACETAEAGVPSESRNGGTRLEWRSDCGAVEAYNPAECDGAYVEGDREDCIDCDSPVERACQARLTRVPNVDAEGVCSACLGYGANACCGWRTSLVATEGKCIGCSLSLTPCNACNGTGRVPTAPPAIPLVELTNIDAAKENGHNGAAKPKISSIPSESAIPREQNGNEVNAVGDASDLVVMKIEIAPEWQLVSHDVNAVVVANGAEQAERVEQSPVHNIDQCRALVVLDEIHTVLTRLNPGERASFVAMQFGPILKWQLVSREVFKSPGKQEEMPKTESAPDPERLRNEKFTDDELGYFGNIVLSGRTPGYNLTVSVENLNKMWGYVERELKRETATRRRDANDDKPAVENATTAGPAGTDRGSRVCGEGGAGQAELSPSNGHGGALVVTGPSSTPQFGAGVNTEELRVDNGRLDQYAFRDGPVGKLPSEVLDERNPGWRYLHGPSGLVALVQLLDERLGRG
jgi:hypothetical protein